MSTAIPSWLEEYEQLLAVNRSLNEAADALGKITVLHPEARERLHAQAQRLTYLRSSVAAEVLEMLLDLEQAAATQLDGQIRAREDRTRDPDEVYLEVAQRERERKEQGVPARVRFLGREDRTTSTPAGKRMSRQRKK
ncbi:MAG: hypothetical protein H0X25_02200 [Acidobacteriales bacterium]|nr:hypothetical protein [Terriglobales bacterium]